MFRSFAEEANALRKGGFNVEENALVVNIASHREPDGRLGIGLFWGHGHWASRLPAREYASIFLGPGFSLCNENDANAYALIRAIESHPASYVGLEIRTDSVIAFRYFKGYPEWRRLSALELGEIQHSQFRFRAVQRLAQAMDRCHTEVSVIYDGGHSNDNGPRIAKRRAFEAARSRTDIPRPYIRISLKWFRKVQSRNRKQLELVMNPPSFLVQLQSALKTQRTITTGAPSQPQGNGSSTSAPPHRGAESRPLAPTSEATAPFPFPVRDALTTSLLSRLEDGGFHVTPRGVMVHSDASIRKGIAGIGLYWGKGYWADAMVRSERPPSWVVKSTSAEFYAVIRAIELHPAPLCDLEVRTDCKYAVEYFNDYAAMRDRQWRRWPNKPGLAKDIALLKRLGQALEKVPCHVTVIYTPGHKKLNYMNGRADTLAKQATYLPPPSGC